MKKRVWLSMLSSLMWTFVVCALVFGVGFLIAKDANSSDLEYRSLDYDVHVQENGDLRIKETVDIKLHERTDSDDNSIPWKQLYQTYTLNAAQLTNITDVSVKNLTTGEAYTQIEPKQPKYVPSTQWDREYANHWYIADVTYNGASTKTFDPAVDGLESRTRTQMGEDERADMGGADAAADADGDTKSSDRPHDKTIEIGWNIPGTYSADSMRFEITMTWEGVTTQYNDVSVFQWEPFGTENETPIGVAHINVTFPEGVGRDDSWAWLHYTGNAKTERTPHGIACTAYNVKTGQYLDIVAMMTNAPLHNVVRHVDANAKQWTIDDETRQEREWHDKQHKAAVIRVCIWVAIALAGATLSFFGIRAALRSRRKAKLAGDVEYSRDVPPMTPGAAAVLWTKIGRVGVSSQMSREMAATMMSLIDKKLIAVYPGEAKRYAGVDLSRVTSADVARLIASSGASARKLAKTSTIVLMPRALGETVTDGYSRTELGLCTSERRLLNILLEAYKRLRTPVFDIKQMNREFSKWTDGHEELDFFKRACEHECDDLDAVQPAKATAVTFGVFDIMLAVLAGIYLMAFEGNLLLACCLCIPMVLCGILSCVLHKNYEITDSGQRTVGELVGFERYLEDFSTFADREVLDVTLWGKYLVYAAALGVSRKVLRQLATAYPQVNDAAWLDDNAYASGVLFWSARPSTIVGSSLGAAVAGGSFGAFAGGFTDFGTQLSAGMASVQSTIAAAAPSSSGSGGFSGSGGSFSGGGFGGSSGGSGGGSFGGR
ncbi:MAG: DUF2207 domain-containing protein [Bifidobacterium criceti]|nr:DUF2207 domain-containing protein [Bifidobacterium criceti]